MKRKIFNLSNLIMLIKALTSFQKQHFKAAMLIDADNVTPNLVKYALEKTEQDYGKIKKRLIYGNWASPNLNSIWNESIRKFRLERVDNHSKSKGKKFNRYLYDNRSNGSFAQRKYRHIHSDLK